MTQAKPPAPVLVRLRRFKIALAGVAVGALSLLLLAISIQDATSAAELSFATKLFGGIALLMAPISILMLGLAWRAPVALRMDAHGISGYYTAPATWDEIAEIGVQDMSKGHSALGFRLKDPVAFRDRQTAWQRFTSWSNGGHDGYHISINSTIMRGTDPQALCAQAQAFSDAAQTRNEVPRTGL